MRSSSPAPWASTAGGATGASRRSGLDRMRMPPAGSGCSSRPHPRPAPSLPPSRSPEASSASRAGPAPGSARSPPQLGSQSGQTLRSRKPRRSHRALPSSGWPSRTRPNASACNARSHRCEQNRCAAAKMAAGTSPPSRDSALATAWRWRHRAWSPSLSAPMARLELASVSAFSTTHRRRSYTASTAKALGATSCTLSGCTSTCRRLGSFGQALSARQQSASLTSRSCAAA
mmetsp:Transcript_68823/g.194994  ORF Transcript_68823/g.194994 Transcript_68823/m.194994 type:complete len:231 (+) Transcript_68823:3-695(+)